MVAMQSRAPKEKKHNQQVNYTTMKKLLFGLWCAAFAIGCTTDPYQTDVPAVEGAPRIEISGKISQNYATRVDDGGFCQGDQVGLFGVNYTDSNTVAGALLDKGNQVDNARYTYDKANGQWVSNGSFYYKDVNTNIDLYAYYPYAAVNNTSEYEFEVAADQSGVNSTDGYALSDFLWAKATNVTPSQNKVSLHFYHRMSATCVALKEGQGFESGEFEKLSKTVLAMNTTRTSTIDLSTGKVTATGKAAREGIVMKSGAEDFRAIVVPQRVEAGQTLFSITINGIPYTFKYKVQNELKEWIPASFTYEAGKQSKFTITINKKKHSGEYEFILTDTQIVDWIADIDTHAGEGRQYYVVHLDEAGTLEAKILADDKNPAKIKNLKVSGKIDARDFYFMRHKMEILQSVNLKESQITAIWGANCGCSHEHWWFSETEHSDIHDFMAQQPDYCNYGYTSLTGWFPADEIPANAFKGKSTLVNFVFPEKVTKIGSYAFNNCSLLAGALIIPDDVVEIENETFSGCSNITSLSLPPHLEIIGDNAFNSCSALSGNLELPYSLKSIGRDAFASCNGFTGPLVLPDNLEHLGASAFWHCSGFTGDLVIPTSLTNIWDWTFMHCSGLNGRLVLHDGVQLVYDGLHGPAGGQFNGCNFQGELKLPANLLSIPESCFSGCQFSTIAEFPKGLIEIANNAFYGNSRLMGTLEFPDELVALGSNAFEYCQNLEGVVLPAELAVLKSNVFNNCYNLNKIVCKAIEPPYVQSGAFDGVAKDNFAVEVPEQAINRYQNSAGWNEFKRIVAHHDFTISRRLMRTLNAEHTREFVLRAPSGFAWSVESMPEWVTVTPSSGVGKTEVTVTVSEMTADQVGEFEINTGSYNRPNYEYNRGRAGEVVFLLDGKDYRATMKVEQYDYQYGDGDVIENQRASVGKGVNLVFMGDCFDARDIARGTYLNGINEAIGHYFDIEPYKTYRGYFNVYTVVGMSNDSGMGTVNTIRDAKFGSQYTINAGITPNIDTIIDYSFKTEAVTKQNFNRSLVVMIENTTEYGGVCYMYGDGSAVAICPMSDDAFPYDFRGIVQHEAGGHGFAKLADEYIYHNAFIQSCTCICCSHMNEFNAGKALGWYRNLESTGDMDQVGWSHFIFHPVYSNIVDVYEGGFYHSRGIFRSEPNSCMNNNIPYFSAISRQEAVERIMSYSGQRFDINDFYSKDVRDTYGDQVGTASRAAAVDAISLTGAGKQMPPKYMGETPFK